MSLSSSFDLLSFQRKVQDALQTVERTLELERKPRLAADVDHTYGAKYGLVNLISNTAIIAYVNCFEKLGLDADALKSIEKTKPATLRFESGTSCKFLEEVQVDVPVGRSYEEQEETKEIDSSKTTTKTRVVTAINHVTYFDTYYPNLCLVTLTVGLLSIESKHGENECIHSHSRKVDAYSSLKIPLNSATVLELTGQQHLHGYMNLRFETIHKSNQLVARARQFSSFILVIGTMTDSSTLDPKDAIIVQNKDELIIPLLLEEFPTAKEFKDAVKSLSPEQQRFALAYRTMQLASSVFGICVIQIKPQLEALLGLPADALDKEMKLTQDLMELFVKYQVPSDMLSYNGFDENAAAEDKITNVKGNVKSVLDVVNGEKEKQMKAEQAKTEMAVEKAFQEAEDPSTGLWVPLQTEAQENCDRFYSGLQCQSGDAFYSGVEQQQQSIKHIRPRKIRRRYVVPPRRSAAQQATHLASLSSPSPTERLQAAQQRQIAPTQQIPVTNCSASRVGISTAFTAASPVNDGCRSSMDAMQESSTSKSVTGSTKRGPSEMQNQHTDRGEGKKAKTSGDQPDESKPSSEGGVDFTMIPQILDMAVEKIGSTTIKTGPDWIRNRQENLLTGPKKQSLKSEEIMEERNEAFDLLDALSRSGSLPIAYSDLHVIVAVTHCFDKDIMSTCVCDNINPIDKLECSTLLLASTVHGVPARDLIGDASELQRLEGALPLLLLPSETNSGGGENVARG